MSEAEPASEIVEGATSPMINAPLFTFRVDMEGRGGKFSILPRYTTGEPVRDKLFQRFMDQKVGRWNIWEEHMATELLKTEVPIDAVLGEKVMRLEDVRGIAAGQTIALNTAPKIRSGGVPTGRAQIGQRRNNIAARLLADMFKDVSQ